MERGAIAFITFSKGTLHGEVVKKFSFKSFLEQYYLVLFGQDTKGEESGETWLSGEDWLILDELSRDELTE